MKKKMDMGIYKPRHDKFIAEVNDFGIGCILPVVFTDALDKSVFYNNRLIFQNSAAAGFKQLAGADDGGLGECIAKKKQAA
jgi:hypothetical protein